GDCLRIAGERFAAEVTAPADVAGPGGAIGAAGAVAAGAYGILGGAARQILEFFGASRRIGDDQITEQGGVQDEAPLPCPIPGSAVRSRLGRYAVWLTHTLRIAAQIAS